MAEDLTTFRDTYHAWVKAREELDREIQAVLKGDGTAKERLPAALEHFDRTHKAFMKASKPFVRWRKL